MTQSEKMETSTGAGILLRVEDMSCGHCASTIRNAIESAVPGAKVHADPATHLVSVEGVGLARASELITLAGYTPSAL